MNPTDCPDDLLRHLCDSSRLTREEAVWLVDEVRMYFSESVADFVARRHRELQSAGFSNATIYKRVLAELGARRFPAPALSERQVRRLIYG